MRIPAKALVSLVLGVVVYALGAAAAFGQQPPKAPANSQTAPGVNAAATQKSITEQQELRKAIDDAANDRAALVKNLEEFLKKYPESAQRLQIYRALVESSLQLRDFAKALSYAERMVALNPEDISNQVLTIELLERYGDTPGYRRAVFYCSRVIESVDKSPASEKSPRVSAEDWAAGKKRDKSSLLQARGRLYVKLGDAANAQKDFEASYVLLPNASAAEQLGEIAELQKDWNAAILEYARTFALTDGTNGAPSRAEARKKVGNVWRLAHGSEDGLGEYLLRNFDDTVETVTPRRTARNANATEPYQFVLRKIPEGASVSLADAKGKILVLNFWATWCGPCRALEPHFDRVAAQYVSRTDVVFYALNCDDDETLVAPYLENVKSKTATLFADGLERLLGVDSFPTTVVLDRSGKIAFRSNGYDADSFERSLVEAVERVGQASSASSGPATR